MGDSFSNFLIASRRQPLRLGREACFRSLARSVPKAFKMGQEGEGEGEGAKSREIPLLARKKKQPSVGQRKANKSRWRKNNLKTHGNFFRKKKIKPKKNSHRGANGANNGISLLTDQRRIFRALSFFEIYRVKYFTLCYA